jgi:uncharacterized membrane protein
MSPIALARWTTLGAYFSLLTLVIAWHAWLSPPGRIPTALVLATLTLPLLAPLRGLLHGRAYTHAWTSFIALLYFVLGVAHAAVAPERLYGTSLIVVSLTLFFGCLVYARLSSRQNDSAQS